MERLGCVALPCGCEQKIPGYGRETDAWNYCADGLRLRTAEKLLGYQITDATFNCRAGVLGDRDALDKLIRRRRNISGRLNNHLDILRHRPRP